MADENVPGLKYWIGFNIVSGIGPAKLRALLDHFGSLADAWQANPWQLQQIGIDRRSVENFLETRSTIDLDAEYERVKKAGIRILVWESPDYPKYLKEIPNPPPLLYMKGQMTAGDQWAVAVVGTRRLTAYGRQVTQDLVRGLVNNNITIVSGLARGIDAVAHQAAVDAGGRTIAVLGSGLDNLYPTEHRKLADRIASGQGAILTEYALGVPPEARNFPPRNRVISGLSMGVVIVEAGRKSGALITSKFALEQDREVFAVPGNINSPASVGTNKLIQQGAKLVRTVDDVLEELNLTMVPQQAAVQQVIPETAEEAVLLEYLTHQPIHIDEIIRQVDMPSGLVGSTLALMELKGMVQQVGGMNYVLAREPEPIYEIGNKTSGQSEP
jgi:DNA processing protein